MSRKIITKLSPGTAIMVANENVDGYVLVKEKPASKQINNQPERYSKIEVIPFSLSL